MNSRQLNAVASMLALAACSRPAAPAAAPGRATDALAAATVATFEGSYQPGQGLTIRTAPAGWPVVQGRVAYMPWQDGSPGSGPDNTFELVTEPSPPPGSDPNGCATLKPDFHGDITLRSFFRELSFTDVAIELLTVSTGYEACLDDTPGAGSGMSGVSGFWDYGPIGVAGSNTRTWRFNFDGGQAFTFTGRIMAQAAPLPVPANGAAAFEWVPSMLLDPPHSFQHVPTTLSHVVWDEATNSFTHTVGSISLQPVGSPGWTTMGLSYPRQGYATGFTESNYFEADAAHGGNSVDTTGDFTVCTKFKPGANPTGDAYKVLVGKGNPISGYGWALAHLRLGAESEYSFVYWTGEDTSGTRAIVGPASATPERRAYDYFCGGRNGDAVYVDAFGQLFGFAIPVTGAIPSPETLPIAIGAAAGGAYPYLDGGVYEVIWDSRAITASVAGQIIAAAEGRATVNGAYWLGFPNDGPTVPGADLAGYLLPRGAGTPLTTDGSGLLDAGTQLTFNQVFQANPAGGYCIGAEVVAADWTIPSGFILSGSGGSLRILINPDGTVIGVNGDAYSPPQEVGLRSWLSGTRHTFKVCSTEHGSLPPNVMLDVDSNAYSWQGTSDKALDDLAAGQLLVGASTPLTGARIGRVFACPTPTAGSCN